MAKKPKIPDTSTITELLVKEWSDHYPPETISALNAKAQSLSYTITSTQEEYTKLTIAQGKLDNLTSMLPPLITSLDVSLMRRQDFIKEYGDLGAVLKVPYETMDATLRSYVEYLNDYAKQVRDRYFSNLEEVRKSLAYLTHLRDLYRDIAAIPAVIRMDFLKTPEDRRKPIIRELYRLFKAVAENHLFFGLDPNIENPLIPNKIDAAEFKSLCNVRKEAERFAELIKTSR